MALNVVKRFINKWGKRIVHQVQLLFEILQNRDLGRRTRYAYYYKYMPVSKKRSCMSPSMAGEWSAIRTLSSWSC